MAYFRSRKVDANQNAVVWILRDAGCHVTDLSGVGRGCADLLVLAPNELRPVLMEVKNKAGRGDKLTGPQKKFHAEYWGVIHRVTSPAEALAAMGLTGIVGESAPPE